MIVKLYSAISDFYLLATYQLNKKNEK